MKKETNTRILIEQCNQIEDKAICPADRIIAGYLKRKLMIKFIKEKYPQPEDI